MVLLMRKNSSTIKAMEIVEISMGKGKEDSRDISKRASTCFFHNFPITENDKLGTTWTNMSLFYAWFTHKMPDWGPRNFCLLSGRSSVQFRSGTPVFCSAYAVSAATGQLSYQTGALATEVGSRRKATPRRHLQLWSSTIGNN